MSKVCEIFLGYLGPEGTHSYGVASLLKERFQVFEALGFSVSLIPCQTLAELMTKTMVGSISLALLPLENALEGSVFEVLETLGTEGKKLEPLLEMLFPITHALIVHPDLPDLNHEASIKTILSHPQALAQCRHTLYELFGDSIQLSSCSSTAQAVQSLALLDTKTQSYLSFAALGSPEAAVKYGLKIIKDNVSDVPNNMTRFLLLAGEHFFESRLGETPQSLGFSEWRKSISALGPRKTSLFLGTEDTPGALVQVLNLFKNEGLNLTKIESRPSRKQFGDYVFYLDVAADLTHPQYHSFLEAVKAATPVLRVIGSYGCLGCLTV